MDYLHIINKIIEAEQRAREIAGEAETKKQSLDSDIKEELDKLHNEYKERVKRRVAIIAQREQELANEKITELEKELENSLSVVNEAAAQKKDEWVGRFFDLIVNS